VQILYCGDCTSPDTLLWVLQQSRYSTVGTLTVQILYSGYCNRLYTVHKGRQYSKYCTVGTNSSDTVLSGLQHSRYCGRDCVCPDLTAGTAIDQRQHCGDCNCLDDVHSPDTLLLGLQSKHYTVGTATVHSTVGTTTVQILMYCNSPDYVCLALC
jgi:hypothetical protein